MCLDIVDHLNSFSKAVHCSMKCGICQLRLVTAPLLFLYVSQDLFKNCLKFTQSDLLLKNPFRAGVEVRKAQQTGVLP